VFCAVLVALSCTQKTPLVAAIKTGNVEAVENVLDSGADINQRTAKGMTP
jgi:ankyrin repeat protein